MHLLDAEGDGRRLLRKGPDEKGGQPVQQQPDDLRDDDRAEDAEPGREIRFDPEMTRMILAYGLPSGLQNSVIALANVVVQSNINAYGEMAMSGCGAYGKVEGFAFLPITSFTMACTTFVGQNLGAKQYDRAKRGARFCILIAVIMAELIGLCYYIWASELITLFDGTPGVVALGVQQARTVALFYCLLAFSHSRWT